MTPQSPIRVLVVDDDPQMLTLIRGFLASAGFDASGVADGREALEAIRARCPHLVISDWEMPRMSGPALCRAIRREPLPHYVVVVLLTAKTSEAEMIEGLEAGADDFISKPIKAPVLFARLRAGMRVLEMEERLRELATRDALTGALNRRAFHARSLEEWERATRYGPPLSCAMLDLDYFKRINDTHGHVAGDTVLTTVAETLQRHCRASDLICRYGGEEFCVLLPETNEWEAASWGERVRTAIAELTIAVPGAELRITASVGAAQRLADTPHVEALIDLADQALAVAKRSGRNRVVRQSAVADSAIPMSAAADAASPLDGVRACDIMTPAVICPSADDTLATVTDLMLESRVNSLPLVEPDGQLAGIVSEIDLANATALGRSWEEPVRSIMRSSVPCFDEQVPARQVLDFLARFSLRRVVVVRGRRPVGVVSRANILRCLRNGRQRGEAVSAGEWPAIFSGPTEVRRRDASRIVEAAQRRLSALSRVIADETAEFMPALVAEATRLQELAADLLSHAGSGGPF